MRHLSCVLTALTLAASLPGVAAARPVAPAFIPAGEVADAPAGFVDLCTRDAALCALGRASGVAAVAPRAAAGPAPMLGPTASIAPSAVHAAAPAPASTSLNDNPLYQMMRTVNRDVNVHVYQASDIRAWGVGELWRRPNAGAGRVMVGDCEDIAIEKRVRLTEMGFPAERLFYAVVYHPAKGLHTILIARLDDGDYVLDSLTPRIERWSQTHYVWLRGQMPGSPETWVRIANWRTGGQYAEAVVAKAPA